jgi:hypothetical protein
MVQDLVVHFKKVVCHLGSIEPVDQAILELALCVRHRSIREPRRLGDAIDDIHPEPITTFVQPEPHYIPDRVADFRVLPVEIWL